MKIFPHINYYFSMLPVTPTDKWFKSTVYLITHFYWKNKKKYITLPTLQISKSQGGLDAPNFFYYNLANQLQYLAKWIDQTNRNIPWIEQLYCKNILLSNLPFLNTTIKQHPCLKILCIPLQHRGNTVLFGTTLISYFTALLFTIYMAIKRYCTIFSTITSYTSKTLYRTYNLNP